MAHDFSRINGSYGPSSMPLDLSPSSDENRPWSTYQTMLKMTSQGYVARLYFIIDFSVFCNKSPLPQWLAKYVVGHNHYIYQLNLWVFLSSHHKVDGPDPHIFHYYEGEARHDHHLGEPTWFQLLMSKRKHIRVLMDQPGLGLTRAQPALGKAWTKIGRGSVQW